MMSGIDLSSVIIRALHSYRQPSNLGSDAFSKEETLETPVIKVKGAGAAVAMFLSQDAVAPSALPLPDRSARRLCDRLVALGAVRELTGRDSFRLYGV